MKISSAFPHILEREFPVVKPEYPMLTVLYLLRMKDVAAVPLTSGRATENRVVFGFSSLAKLMTLGPGRFGAYLREPCENASDRLPSVGVDQDIRSLLDAFNAKRLGFAIVRGPNKKRGLVTLADVLGLYSNGSLSSKMCVRDVAMPIFSMPASTSIREVVRRMFSHRYRRVFLSGEEKYVSDRNIMDRIFSPIVIDRMAEYPKEDVLAAPINTLEGVNPISVPPLTTFKTAAEKLEGDSSQCLTVNGKRVVTPWDLVMNPWLSGKLTIH